MKLYILDKDRQVVPASDMEEWGASLASPGRFVGQRIFAEGAVFVSTVFLGIDALHDFRPTGLPLVFETMVFGGALDGHQERCSTWAEAEETHERVCAEVRQRVLH